MSALEARGVSANEALRVEDDLRIVAGLTEAIMQLPAIATLDWCDDAARCLEGIGAGAGAAVLVGNIETDGRLRDLEAIGFAVRRGDAALLSDLRCRAEAWDTIGMPRPVLADGHAELVACDTNPSWPLSSIGRTWRDLGAQRVVMAFAGLGSAGSSRVLAVLVGVSRQESANSVLAQVRAVMPLLRRRALMAIGAERTRRNNWISPKELGVLDQLVLGKSVREIAEELDRSPHTVHDHVKSLHRKLGASSRGELIARALGHTSVGGQHNGMPRVDRSDYADPPAGLNGH